MKKNNSPIKMFKELKEKSEVIDHSSMLLLARNIDKRLKDCRDSHRKKGMFSFLSFRQLFSR